MEEHWKTPSKGVTKDMITANLTKTFIATLEPADRPYYVCDEELPSLLIRVGRSKKTFYVNRWFEGKSVYIRLGEAPFLSPSLARERAYEIVGKMSSGADPRKPDCTKVTIRQVYEDFKKERKLRAGTLRTYDSVFKNHYGIHFDDPIASITEDIVISVHTDLGNKGQEQYANQVSRTFRSLFNFARAKYKTPDGKRLLGDNPINCLSERKLWYRQKRRKTFLDEDQIPRWLNYLEQMPNRLAADLYLLLLLTGLRREEVVTLRWENVDMERGYFSIVDAIAKNGDEHTLPMTPRVQKIFESRLAARVNGYVFPGADGHVTNIRRQRDQIVKGSKIVFTPHDLRRTFTTAAESLDINRYLLKKLLNHRADGDVTAGYIMWRPKRLLKPLCRIEKLILEGPDDQDD